MSVLKFRILCRIALLIIQVASAEIIFSSGSLAALLEALYLFAPAIVFALLWQTGRSAIYLGLARRLKTKAGWSVYLC